MNARPGGIRFAVVVLVTTSLMIACAESPGASTAGPASTPTSAVAEPRADVVDIDTLGSTTIAAEPFADWLVAEPNGMWVANVDSGLVRMDLADGTKTAEVAVGEVPLALEVAGGALWAATYEPAPEIIRVPLDDPTAAIHIALPLDPRVESSITSDGALVWLLVGGPLSVVGIDQATGAIVRNFEVAPGLQGLRFAEGALWASSPASAELVRLDPASGAETLRIAVGPQPAFIATAPVRSGS